MVVVVVESVEDDHHQFIVQPTRMPHYAHCVNPPAVVSRLEWREHCTALH